MILAPEPEYEIPFWLPHVRFDLAVRLSSAATGGYGNPLPPQDCDEELIRLGHQTWSPEERT